MHLVLDRSATPVVSVGTMEEPLRVAFGRNLVDLFDLFNQKQDERGPENVIKAGAEGILTQTAERIERVRAALARGKTSPEELRLNALDIAGFGIILTMILDGTWQSEDGRKPSLTVKATGTAPAQYAQVNEAEFVDKAARSVIRMMLHKSGYEVDFDQTTLIRTGVFRG